jgi:hypothetical protein
VVQVHWAKGKAEIEKATKQSIAFFVATIVLIIGAMSFIGHRYIAKELKSYIEAVGPNNVIKICLNNASAILGELYELV